MIRVVIVVVAYPGSGWLLNAAYQRPRDAGRGDEALDGEGRNAAMFSPWNSRFA